MSPVPPYYFVPIRRVIEERWRRLENDPDIAGPWRLLFKQVQSPRHVLSELLQNADDVGAKNAVVNLENNVFSFMHDGQDFSEAHFQSICRFGYSNKREMHTIGFRGIGFKSVFSLGDRVYLLTPTLSVYFDSARFTLPVWTNAVARRPGWTEIRIEIKDNLRRQEFEANIQEWMKTGVSLLFFRNIRSFRVGNMGIQWQVQGPGPAQGTEWMTRLGGKGGQALLARSGLVPFPPECLEEIRKERQVFDSDSIQTPPSAVEIVPGAKGRLFVILPTGVETRLPFACNAPFVQDPARLKIKELEISPTNRWLLERIGQLAADVLLGWVSNTNLPAERRTHAYQLLFQPSELGEDEAIQLSDRVERFVSQTMVKALEGKPFLIDSEGKPCAPGLVYSVDPEIQAIWSSEQILALAGTPQGALLHSSVSKGPREILAAQGHVVKIDKSQVIQWLKDKPVPRPTSWGALARLWAYVAPELLASVQKIDFNIVAVIPTQGEWLVKSPEVIRPKPGVVFEEDETELLAKHLKLVDESWIDYIDPDSNAADNEFDPAVIKARLIAADVYQRLGAIPFLSKQAITTRLATLASADPHFTLEQCAIIVRMAVGTDAELPDSFLYFSRDGQPKPARSMAIDLDGFLEEVMPEEWKTNCLLHPRLTGFVDSENFRHWSVWVASPKSVLARFPQPRELLPPVIMGREKIVAWLEAAGGETSFPRHGPQEFRITDYGYDDIVLHHWKTLPSQTQARVFKTLLENHREYLAEIKQAFVESLVRIGKWSKVATAAASWLRFFRDSPCLNDANGVAAKPSELVWQTKESGSLKSGGRPIDPWYEKSGSKEILEGLGLGVAPSTDDSSATSVDRAASDLGFVPNPARRNHYTHPDGRSITRDGQAAFPWQVLDSSGKPILQFQVLDATGIAGFDIPHEQWAQFRNATPEAAYLVEHPTSDSPQLLGFKDLEPMIDSGEWALEPTGYRLIRKKYT